MAGFTHPWSPAVTAGDRQGQAVGAQAQLGSVTVARLLAAGMPCSPACSAPLVIAGKHFTVCFA